MTKTVAITIHSSRERNYEKNFIGEFTRETYALVRTNYLPPSYYID